MSGQVVGVVSIKSTTEKTYTVTLSDCEPRKWPYSSSGRTYRPVRMVVVKREGNVSSVTLTGPQVLKNGSDGSQWATECFYTKDRPAWMVSIIGGLA